MDKRSKHRSNQARLSFSSSWQHAKDQMNKHLLGILLLALSSSSCPASETNFVTTLSPKLRSLLSSNQAALGILSNAYCARTSSVQVTYFYSEDDSQARAAHFYPNIVGTANVLLCIRENQRPLDEFVCIFYELLNSKNQSRFEALVQKAKAGVVRKEEFVTALMRIEFESDLAVRDVLKQMKLTKEDKAQSYFYSRLVNCPDDFEEAETYRRKVSPARDVRKEYEAKYDELRKRTGDY